MTKRKEDSSICSDTREIPAEPEPSSSKAEASENETENKSFRYVKPIRRTSRRKQTGKTENTETRNADSKDSKETESANESTQNRYDSNDSLTTDAAVEDGPPRAAVISMNTVNITDMDPEEKEIDRFMHGYRTIMTLVPNNSNFMSDSSNEFKNFVFNFMVAGSVGAVGKSLTAPIDRIKVILQTQYSSKQILENKREPYKGILDCIVRIPREQGIRSFWRGNTVNVLRYFPTQALNFSLNDYISKKILSKANFDQKRFVSFISGGMSGAITMLVMYPLEYCQTRISADIGSDKRDVNGKYYIKREFSGMPDCISKTSKRGGIKAFYSSIGIATVGMSLYRTMYFGLYDLFKTFLAHKPNNTDKRIKLLSALFVAQCITITASTFTYPLDTLGRRLMMELAKNKVQQRFNNTWGAAKSIFAEDGIRSFYKGIIANYLKGFSGALILVMYDEITTYFA
ncbi:hypothetical protein FQR65_LT15827 [Abscondita terminalis]|nr:hypothetical protein FQR65_LT15827 [Abscondita terminalis]